MAVMENRQEPGRRELGRQEPDREPGIVLTPEQQRSRRNRNVAIGVAIAFFALLFYVVTIAKLGSHVLDRPL